MKIEFRDERLALIRTDRATELKLPVAVIKACQDKLDFIEAAPDERSLRNWRSLNYKKLSGDQEGIRQIKVNNQYRIQFELDNDKNPPLVTITFIGDPH